MKKPLDFRPYVPTLETPRIKAMHGRNAHEHGVAGYANPIPRELLFNPWEVLYGEPFNGVTNDGALLTGLYERRDHGAPTVAMVEATTRLITAATPDERKALLLPLNAREWRRWNNTEMYVWKYGLRLEEVGLPLRDRILTVMRAGLSGAGYEKARDVMRFNHFLGELAMNTKVLGEWSYNFTLFGAPSATEPWGWQLSGHHLALNCLVIGGQMVLSPAFMGAEPNYADTGPLKGRRLFQDEENGGLELVRMLSDAQRAQAILYPATVGGDMPRGAAIVPTNCIWAARSWIIAWFLTRAHRSRALRRHSASACSTWLTPTSRRCPKARAPRAWRRSSVTSTPPISAGSAVPARKTPSTTVFKAPW